MAEQPGGAAPLSLVYLDVDDEITSAAARIRAAGADEVALVLPFGSRLATSRINFRLLAREAAERGKKLDIVCADASARALAVAAGLPTHASVAAFEAYRTGAVGQDGGETPGRGAGTDEGAGTGGGAGAGTEAGTATPDAAATAATATATAAESGVPGGGPRSGVGPRQMPLEFDDSPTRVIGTPRRKPERVPLVGPPRPPVRTGVAIGIGLAVIVSIVAGGLLALEFLPSATITLHPRSAAIGPIELTVEAREDVAAPDPAALAIPAQRFTFDLEATQTFPATGVLVELVKATGNVTFSNFDTGRGVVIQSGTTVRTESGVEFVTLAEVTLPRARIDFFPPFPVHPSTASVGVQAAVAGPDGNVGNNTIVEIPRGGRNLFVTNEEPTSGGARNESPEVRAEDVAAAQAAIGAALVAELDRQVAAGEGVPEAVTLFPTTRLAGEPEWSVDPATLIGTLATEFDLGATAEGSVLGVDATPISGIAEAVLAGRVTDGSSIQEGSVVSEVGTPSVLGTTILYPVTIAATQVRDIDVDALQAAIRGLDLPAARAILDDFGDVAISVWPDWVTTIPTRADRVTFDLAEPRPSVAPQ